MDAASLLLVGHDAGGTVPPLVALAQAALGAGHRATVLGQPSMRARSEAVGAGFVAFSALGDYRRDVPLEEQLDLTVPALAGAAVGADLRRVADEVAADVVVVDANLAGALAAAEALDRPSAVLLHSMYATFVDTWFGDLWPLLADAIDGVRAEVGLGPAGSWAGLFAGHDLLLSVVPPRFDAPVADAPATRRAFGFLVPEVPATTTAATTASTTAAAGFPAGDDPTALVSLSTTDQGQGPLLEQIVAALGEVPVRALVTTAGHPHPRGPLPPNVAVAGFVPHAALLPHTDVVVTHAGLGTVAAALAAGVPLVATPIARDQHLNTRRVEAVGAGVGVEDPTPGAVAAAVGRVLGEPALAAGARALAAESRAAGGAPAAVEALVGLRSGPVSP